ncbi:MAG: hypothetical protein QXK07_04100 [Desulfurococcaceae archaeon]
MSVNISIDRRQLLEALLRQYNVIPWTVITYAEPDKADIFYRDGWFFFELRQQGWFPTITHGKVHAELPPYGSDGSVMLVYIHELVNYFFHFFEVHKGRIETYLGTHLSRDGSMAYTNHPDGTAQQLLPPGSIAPGDTLLSGLYIVNDAGTKKVRVIVKKVDFTRRTFVDLVDFTDTITYNYHVVDALGLETKAEPCRFGVAFVRTGPYHYFLDIAPWLLKYGLPDPRTIHPWR